MAKNKDKHGTNHGCCHSDVEAAAPATGMGATSGACAGGDASDRIGRRAYEIWEAEQRPDGRDVDHWLRAEKEVNGGALDAP